MFGRHFKQAIYYFQQDLPYWCDDFNRPYDQQFLQYIRSQGIQAQYLQLAGFEQVYFPITCDMQRVVRTAKKRVQERAAGVPDHQLSILVP